MLCYGKVRNRDWRGDFLGKQSTDEAIDKALEPVVRTEMTRYQKQGVNLILHKPKLKLRYVASTSMRYIIIRNTLSLTQ